MEKSSNIMATSMSEIAKKYPIAPLIVTIDDGDGIFIWLGRTIDEHEKMLRLVIDDTMYNGHPLFGLTTNSQILYKIWMKTIQSIQSATLGFVSSIPSIINSNGSLVDDIKLLAQFIQNGQSSVMVEDCMKEVESKLWDIYINTLCLFDDNGEYTHDLEWISGCFRETEEDLIIWKAYKEFAMSVYQYLEYFYSVKKHYAYLLWCYRKKYKKNITTSIDECVLSVLRSERGKFNVGRVKDTDTDEVYHALYLYTHNSSR